MTINTLTKKDLERIEAFAKEHTTVNRHSACRIWSKTEAKLKIEKAEELAKKRKKVDAASLIGKKVTIVYHYQRNLGTVGYGDWYTEIGMSEMTVTKVTPKGFEANEYYNGKAFYINDKFFNFNRVIAVVL